MSYLLRLATNGYAQLASTFSVASADSLSVIFKASFTGASEIYGLNTSTAERLQYNGTGFFFRLAGTNGNTITTTTIASLVSGYNVANTHKYELRKIPFEDGLRTKYRLFVEDIDCGELMSIYNSGGSTFQFNRIGSASTGFFNGDLYYFDCYVNGVKTRSYDPSATGGSGSTLADTTGSQDGTLNGTYTWVYYDAGGGATYTLALDGGTYTTSGGAASLLFNRTLSLDGGSYTTSGASAETLYNRYLSLDGGSYSSFGGDASALYNRVLTLDGGSYSYSGNSATLTYTPGSGATYSIMLDGGTFSHAGSDAQLLAHRVASLDGGSYSLSVENADLLYHRILSLGAGSFAYSGVDASMLYNRSMQLAGSSYSYSGGAAGLVYSGQVTVTIGAYTISYQPTHSAVIMPHGISARYEA